jgi:EAL domain-containing protein (putative c-di-GMP-specific phosphodiesterase class I)
MSGSRASTRIGSAVLARVAGRPAAANCAVLVQIGNFAVLRRQVGRARANALLSEVAASIADLVPGSEWTIVSPDLLEWSFACRSVTALDRVLAEAEIAFDPPIYMDGEPFHLDLVIGAAISNAADVDDIRLIEEAEQALVEARVERTPIRREVSCGGEAVDRIALSKDMPAAIAAGQMFLHYQPKVHLRRQSITSVEALIRWQHPVRGLISPADFIPIAEESRDIVALTLWTIRQVIADQQVMTAHGQDLRVFINIAAALLADVRFVLRACALVEAGGTKIGFEITETSVIRDPDSAIAHLKMFAAMGIEIAIDDYGAGLSSLAYLKKLPARELKIDKLFITQLTSSNRDPLIVRSTIDLAHALEMEVVAEGVETPSALALLSVMGCDMAQGYLISRPLPLDALLAFMAEHDRRALPAEQVTPLGRLAAAVGSG